MSSLNEHLKLLEQTQEELLFKDGVSKYRSIFVQFLTLWEKQTILVWTIQRGSTPKGYLFSGLRYIKGFGFKNLKYRKEPFKISRTDQLPKTRCNLSTVGM